MKAVLLLFVLLLAFSFNASSQEPTDEFGTQGFNCVLGGLGLAASYVNIPYQPAFDNDTTGCIEMWIYPEFLGTNPKTLMSKGSTSNVSFLFGLDLNGKMVFRIGTTDFLNSSGTSVPVNQWSHVAVIWTGKPFYTVTFFLNGNVNGIPITQTATWNFNNSDVRIGGSQAFISNFFQGMIDEVRFWSVSTPVQIINNRFVGLGDGTGANSGSALSWGSYYIGLVSSWTFNQSGGAVLDYISGYNGSYIGTAASTPYNFGRPIPYNFALKLPGGPGDYMTIPTSTTFNQTADGTFEFWLKPLSFATEQIILCKGNSPSSLSFILGIQASTGKLYFGTGSSIVINTTGTGLTLNQWNHIAVTWQTVSGSFQVRFYKNGFQNGIMSTLPATFPVNLENVYVGNSAIYNLPLRGYLDELRLWNPARSENEIRQYMWTSMRGQLSSQLLGCWPFDGNLNSIAGTAYINGSLNNGKYNYCRLSGYMNDSSSLPAISLISHSTVINRSVSPNTFPASFYINTPFKNIPDNNITGISDSIIVTGVPGLLTGVELFLSIDHTYMSNLVVTLIAPNNTMKNVLNANGGGGKNCLTFMNDNFTNTLTSSTYTPPWGFVKPAVVLGNFNGTPVSGIWKIKCIDGVGGNTGVLKGWGLKFDYVTNGNELTSELPKEFKLIQNYPNPFNPSTNITYHLPDREFVRIKVFDITGREIENLVNEMKDAGIHSISWNASGLPSGVYFYRIETGNFVDKKKMILLK